MLTGARAFGGDTVTDTLARVLEREPDWHMLPASLPTAVRTVLDRCLRKDPAKRIHDISDARIRAGERRADQFNRLPHIRAGGGRIPR